MEYDKRKEIRFSSEQDARWREAAEKAGYESVSDWIREACDRQADKDLKK